MFQQTDSKSDSAERGKPGDPLEHPHASFGNVKTVQLSSCGLGELSIDLSKAKCEVFNAEAKEWPDDEPENWECVTMEADSVFALLEFLLK